MIILEIDLGGPIPEMDGKHPQKFIEGLGVEIKEFLIDSILALNPDERLIFLDELRANVCLHCGNPDPRCQCSNDE